jgi:hypothetical protein
MRAVGSLHKIRGLQRLNAVVVRHISSTVSHCNTKKNIPNSSDNCWGGKMLCSHCGKNVEGDGVVLQGHAFCNNLCHYSFQKANRALKTQPSDLSTNKEDNVSNIKRIDAKSSIHAAEIKRRQNRIRDLQTKVDKRARMAEIESLSNNKYFKLVCTILIVIIGFLIYRGFSNFIGNKLVAAVIWTCICSIGFIAASAAKKQNKPQGQESDVDNRGDKMSSVKSIFDNNYLKLVFAILTALFIYRGITNYIEYKQTEAALKDLDKTMIQFDKNMQRYIKK